MAPRTCGRRCLYGWRCSIRMRRTGQCVLCGAATAGATYNINTVDGDQYVLSLEVEQDAIKSEEVVAIDLKAGEISLHDNRLIHGSGPNNSDRITCWTDHALQSYRGEMRLERLAHV